MSDVEPESRPGKGIGGLKRGKRAKTFTGCWTCRSRKVKCDLRRPTCERCEKSSLECGGYDIKLRWTNCIKFDPYGIQVPAVPSHSTTDDQQYRRRNIDFVRYREEYEYYEDMDEELSQLHKPPPERIEDGKTWIIKKFGVFRGTEKANELDNVRSKHVRESNHSKDDDNTILDTVIGDAGTFDFFENDSFFMRFPTDHEWITKELEEDVLSSTTAFRGFPITSLPLSSASTTTTTPMDHGLLKNSGTFSQPGIGGTNQSDRDKDAIQVSGFLDDDSSHAKAGELFDDTSTGNLMSEEPDAEQTATDSRGLGPTMPSSAIEIISTAWQAPDVFSDAAINTPFVSPPTSSLVIHGLTRFLLDYYFRNVADLMTVVALKTNPWKTLYFPRALQALGDLAGLGYTSNSRNSLLNALLAVSCFNLSSKFPRNSERSTYFVNLGIEFRSQASWFLRLCLAKTAQEERYKDVLTALLSINSIDVVWGTMTDCHHHLTMCEEFIKARMKERPKISEKAKTLHRVFSFLKLIQDSTSLDKVNEDEITISAIQNTEDLHEGDMGRHGAPLEQLELLSKEKEERDSSKRKRYRERLDEMDGKIKMHSVEKSEKTKTDSTNDDEIPIFMDVVSESYYSSGAKKSDYNVLSTDNLYGLPKSLILLFSDCVHLARHKEYYTVRHTVLPQQFKELRQKIEDRLITWHSEWKFCKPDSEEFINDTIEGVYHHTMSFYNGLLIYFFTMVGELDATSIQSYVEKVLVHLKALGELVISKGVRIVPLMWQGFIAGCGSTSTKTQREFKSWASNLVHNGIGSYWGARQVMLEVWRRRENDEGGDDWYTVYKDWEVNLMLP